MVLGFLEIIIALEHQPLTPCPPGLNLAGRQDDMPHIQPRFGV
jgi:hypothetical protein